MSRQYFRQDFSISLFNAPNYREISCMLLIELTTGKYARKIFQKRKGLIFVCIYKIDRFSHN